MNKITFTKSKLATNIAFSVIQVIISGITLFFLYKYLFNVLGTEKFGVWSIVIASTSSLGVLNFGFAGSLVKYVTKYNSLSDWNTTQTLIETTLVTIGVTLGIILIVTFPLLKSLFNFLISSNVNLIEANTILPYCLLSFWISMLSGVFQSSLEGFNQTYIKNCILIFSSFSILTISFFLVPKYGLLGLSWSYVLSNSFTLLLSWYFVKRMLPLLPFILFKWQKAMFKETLSYSTSFQIISITTMLNDPVTKFILTKYAGLEITGLYEMASKLVIQVRTMIVYANQAMVPIFANLAESDPLNINKYYQRSYRYLFPISILTFFTLIALSPAISILWLGKLSKLFCFFIVLTSVGWCINTITVPAYFVNLGTGKMRWNVTSHIVMGFMNLLLCFLLAFFGGKESILIGWILALSVCSLLIIVMYHIENSISLKEIIPSENYFFLSCTLLNTLALNFITYYFIQQKLHNYIIYVVVFYFIIELLLIVKHPAKKEALLLITYKDQ